MTNVAKQLERKLSEAGLYLVVEDSDDTIVVSGLVQTENERQAVQDIVTRALGGTRTFEDNIEVSGALAERTPIGDLSETEIAGLAGAEPGLEDSDQLAPGDFTDQQTSTSAATIQSASMSGSPSDDPDLSSSGDMAYVPPIDPVGDGDHVVGGFQASSMSSALEVERSSDGSFGDEAIHDAVIDALRGDAATTGLKIEVSVFNGTVHLDGHVDDLEDVESAEEVSARVPGVLEVIEDLEVTHLS